MLDHQYLLGHHIGETQVLDILQILSHTLQRLAMYAQCYGLPDSCADCRPLLATVTVAQAAGLGHQGYMAQPV